MPLDGYLRHGRCFYRAPERLVHERVSARFSSSSASLAPLRSRFGAGEDEISDLAEKLIDLQHRPTWLYEKNPIGRVPVLEEHGFACRSRA